MRAVSATVLFVLAVALSAAPGQSSRSRGPSQKDSPSKSTAPTSYGGKTLAQWMAQLRSADSSKRTLAVMAIPQFGDAAATAVPALIDRVYDQDVSPRTKALYALRQIAVDKKHIPLVVATLASRIDPAPAAKRRETQVSVRYEAAMTLKRFYKDARPAIPALVNGTRDKGSWELRHQCTWILWRLAADPKNGPDRRAVDALLQTLMDDSNYMVRMEAIQGLGRMGRPSDSTRLSRVISELTKCTNTTVDANRPLTIWAFAALVNLQEGTAAEAPLAKLARYLKATRNVETRVQAAGALGSLGDKAKSRIPDLVALLKDKETVIVQAAAMALSGIGDSDEKVVDGLLKVCDHKDPATAATGIIALVNLKADYPRVIKKLKVMDEAKGTKVNADLRKTANQALKALTEKKKPAK